MLKKRIAALLLALMLLPGCGTGEGDVQGDSLGTAQDAGGSAATAQPTVTGKLEIVIKDFRDNDMCVTESGVYQCMTLNYPTHFLCFIDAASGQKSVLCTRRGCRHEDESCEAYRPNAGHPFVVGDALYLFSLPEWTEDGPGNYYIERRNLDGSGAERWWEMDAEESFSDGAATDGEYLYFLSYRGRLEQEGREPEWRWNRLRLADGTREIIASWDIEQGGYSLLGIAGDKVVLGTQDVSDCQLYLCDPATFSLTPSFAFSSEQLYYRYLDEGIAYLIGAQTGELRTVDLLTGEEKTVIADLGLKHPDMSEIRTVVDGRYLALYSYEWPNGDEEMVLYAYAVDLQQQTVKGLPFRYDFTRGTTEPYWLECILPDGRMLFKMGFKVVVDKDSEVIPQLGIDNTIEGLISAEDYFAGRDQFAVIDAG